MTEMTHQGDVEEEEVVALDPLALYFDAKTMRFGWVSTVFGQV